MFYQVTAESIVTSFLFGLLLSPFILHVAPVSGPDYHSKQILGNTKIDPYDSQERLSLWVNKSNHIEKTEK